MDHPKFVVEENHGTFYILEYVASTDRYVRYAQTNWGSTAHKIADALNKGAS